LYRFDFGAHSFQASAMNLSDLSAAQLRHAADLKEQLAVLQQELA
jgi:hypothetical protein